MRWADNPRRIQLNKVLCVLAAVTMFMAFATTTHAAPVENEVRHYFADVPILATIAGCESRFRQFDENGRVLKNPNSSASGVMQIMSSIHRREAARLGYDIYTLEGNLAYALHLYLHEGTTPWNASRHCWG